MLDRRPPPIDTPDQHPGGAPAGKERIIQSASQPCHTPAADAARSEGSIAEIADSAVHECARGQDDLDGDRDCESAQPANTEHLYTPAMLAELLDVPVRTVRRWQGAGLLAPVALVMQLPYFDYAQLSTAKQLAKWMRQGLTVASIQHQLQALRSRLNDTQADQVLIHQLPIAVEGRKLVLRHDDAFVEASGQFRFEFDAQPDGQRDASQATIPFQPLERKPSHHQRQQNPLGSQAEPSLDEMINQAVQAEDECDFESAIDWYRAALAAYGPNPDVCFQIAELLYRQGDLQGARERYFIALELNPTQVEARANLGCVLAECGQTDLAIAAFQGALEQYADYADVHFHLARALDDAGHPLEAAEHWMRFLELSPESPWADEARERLQQATPLLEF